MEHPRREAGGAAGAGASYLGARRARAFCIALRERPERFAEAEAAMRRGLPPGLPLSMFPGTYGAAHGHLLPDVDALEAALGCRLYRQWPVCETSDVLRMDAGLEGLPDWKAWETYVSWHRCWTSERANNYIDFYNRHLKLGEVAACVSHARVWETACDEHLDVCFVFEDDARPARSALLRCLDDLAVLEAAGQDWDLLYLHSARYQRQEEQPVGRSTEFLFAGHRKWAGAYVLSREGLAKLARSGYRGCVFPVDDFLPALHSFHPRPDVRALECVQAVRAAGFVALTLPDGAGAVGVEDRGSVSKHSTVVLGDMGATLGESDSDSHGGGGAAGHCDDGAGPGAGGGPGHDGPGHVYRALCRRLFGSEGGPRQDAPPGFEEDHSYPDTNVPRSLLGALFRAGRPRFLVEVGSFKGGSALRIAEAALAARGGEGPLPCLLCVDTFLGDHSMWLDRRPGWRDGLLLRHGFPQLYGQFMANTRRYGDVILPLPLASLSALRGLQHLVLEGAIPQPDFIYLDAAHEKGETLQEMTEAFRLLGPGGVLLGDDLDWPAVESDLRAFVRAQAEGSFGPGPDDPVLSSLAGASFRPEPGGGGGGFWALGGCARSAPQWAVRKAPGAGALGQLRAEVHAAECGDAPAEYVPTTPEDRSALALYERGVALLEGGRAAEGAGLVKRAAASSASLAYHFGL